MCSSPNLNPTYTFLRRLLHGLQYHVPFILHSRYKHQIFQTTGFGLKSVYILNKLPAIYQITCLRSTNHLQQTSPKEHHDTLYHLNTPHFKRPSSHKFLSFCNNTNKYIQNFLTSFIQNIAGDRFCCILLLKSFFFAFSCPLSPLSLNLTANPVH